MAAPATRSTSPRALPFLAATAIVTAMIAGLAAWSLWPSAQPRPVNRFYYDFPEGQVLRNMGRSVIALSPDGRRFVYNTTAGLYLRSMDDLDARLIPGTEENFAAPFFSPDGRSIAYWVVNRQLKRIGVNGRGATSLADFRGLLDGADWARDGTIFYGALAGIFRVSADGGKPQLVIPVKDGEQIYGPELLPGGDNVLFSSTTSGDWNRAQIIVQSLSTGKRTVLLDGGSEPRYVPPGYLVYARGNSLFAVAFDARRLIVSGEPVQLVTGVMRAASNPTGAANYGVSNDGTLVYVSGSAGNPRLVWVDRAGSEEPLALKPCLCYTAALSPDGKRLAFSQVTSGQTDGDVWVWSLTEQTSTRLTVDAGLKQSPLWTQDGKRIAYRSPKGLFWLPADGTGAPEQLLEGSDLTPFGWTTDGELIFTDSSGGSLDVGVVAVAGDRKRRLLLDSKFNEDRPALSPDGRWLAYQSDETGRYEIYVRTFPNVGEGKRPVSEGGGEEPTWSRDGTTLFFLGPKSLMAARVETGPELTLESPQAVLERGKYYFPGTSRQYDVSVDGQRFLMAKTDTTARVVVVTNWADELKRRVPIE